MKFEIDSKDLSDTELEKLIDLVVDIKVKNKQKENTANPTIVLQPVQEKIVRHYKKRLENTNKRYSAVELNLIKKMREIEGKKFKQIASVLGRTRDAIEQVYKNKIRQAGAVLPIKRRYTRSITRKHFTSTELQTVIKEINMGNTKRNIAKLLNRTRNSIEALHLRLKDPKQQTILMKQVLAEYPLYKVRTGMENVGAAHSNDVKPIDATNL
jgi:hypothetical protein